MEEILLIKDSEVEQLLDWNELFDAVEEALVLYSQKKLVHPERLIMDIKPHNGTMLIKPSYSEKHGTLATKFISIYPGNNDKNLPSHSSKIFYFDAATGELKAILDGNVITAMRTAVASAVATKALKGTVAKTVAIIGCGIQGESHARVFSRLFHCETFKFWSRRKSNAEKLKEKLTDSKISVEVCDTVEEAVRNADVICTCTNSSKIIVFKDWVKPGCLINCVGAVLKDLRELEEALYHESIVIADTITGAETESGDIIQSKAEIFAEIGEIISGEKKCNADGKTIIFKSQGLAVEDAVSAKLVVDKYEKLNSTK